MPDLDHTYRQGGLKELARPHIHYHDPFCLHAGCGHKMEWIDFQLELFGDRDGIYVPLVRSWWEGRGFVGLCPNCRQWIRFTTLAMEIPSADQVDRPATSSPGKLAHRSPIWINGSGAFQTLAKIKRFFLKT